jgi:hypothetical protein
MNKMRLPFLLLVVLTASQIKAGEVPDGSVPYTLEGKDAAKYTETGRFVLRQLSGDTNPIDLYIPVMERKGVVYIDASGVDKLLLLRARIAEYRKKADELKALGDGIRNDYVQILEAGRPALTK